MGEDGSQQIVTVVNRVAHNRVQLLNLWVQASNIWVWWHMVFNLHGMQYLPCLQAYIRVPYEKI